jgi:hypothetical protein
MDKTVLAFVNKLEGYKTAIKQLHWDAKNMSQHELCDDIAESIAEFQDTVSEVEQSISGKLKINSLNPTAYKIDNLKSFVEDVLDATNTFYKAIKNKGDTYVGMASDCESFLSDMQRKLYLVNFTMKEDFKREFREKIYESMPKNLANTDEVDKFMGRRPKTIKARINQIYRIVKKYGIDSRLYSDEHWQAIEDYYKAISSLGCEVEMKPCGHIENIDSMESDGGYCDYGDDNMAHSKQYAVKITFEDGMSIEGYIKCMAAGTIKDPFARYDTCIVLWPKNNRVLENRYMREENLSWNRSGQLYNDGSSVKRLGGMTKITRDGDDPSYLVDVDPHEFWKKRDERVSESYITEYGDKRETRQKMASAARRGVERGDDEPYINAISSLHKRGSSRDELDDFQKDFENEGRQISLSEDELKQLVKEAATKLIREYGDTPNGQYMLGRLAARQRYRDRDSHEAARTEYYAGYHAPEDERKYREWAKAGKVGYYDGKKEFGGDYIPHSSLRSESIEIDPKNKGKFTATKKATGKSTEELTHSKNPLTRKRAIFAQNAKKWNHKGNKK